MAIDPKYFEWEPKEVPDEQVWEDMRDLGIEPETLQDKKDLEAFKAWLESHPKTWL